MPNAKQFVTVDADYKSYTRWLRTLQELVSSHQNVCDGFDHSRNWSLFIRMSVVSRSCTHTCTRNHRNKLRRAQVSRFWSTVSGCVSHVLGRGPERDEGRPVAARKIGTSPAGYFGCVRWPAKNIHVTWTWRLCWPWLKQWICFIITTISVIDRQIGLFQTGTEKEDLQRERRGKYETDREAKNIERIFG